MVDRDVVLPAELQTLELCSGYGGFSLGLTLAGVEHRTVCHVERDSHAASTLVARMGDKALDRAPIWSDLATFDGVQWRGRVDLITAGFPCQPWSAAGQKRGVDDDRWLWPHIARIITEVGPWLVFLENVPGLNRGSDGGGMSYVLQDLADLGFDAEWGLLSAADIGASQRRERLWILAPAHGNLDRLQAVWRKPKHDWYARHHADGPGGADVGDAGRTHGRGCDGRTQVAVRGSDQRVAAATAGSDVADAESGRRNERFGRSSWRWWLESQGNCFPPRPNDEGGWERWIAADGPEPSLRRSFDGSTGRLVKPAGIADRLHLLGNGLVPLAAAHAFRQLSARLLEDSDDRSV